MNKKICVYAICKNESQFVKRWYESVKEADYVCVLDTGSTDGTYEMFKELGVITEQKKYDFFRFDEARNYSMKLIPEDTDICVCVDIDEFFNPGWSKILKKHWKDGIGRVRYRYTWSFNPDGSEGVVFMADKIHKYGAYRWKYPVHEVLYQIDDKNYEYMDLPNIQLNHKADNTKSRSNYLPLLELSYKENPLDDRNAHYLGREYYFHQEYDKAIEMLNKHLTLPTATWADERASSLRYIAKCYYAKKDYAKQEEYLLKSILETNKVREGYYDLGVMYYEQKEYVKSAFMFEEMFKIDERYLNYISSPDCWGSLPYDYLSMCYYEMGDIRKAKINVLKALDYVQDERLVNNYRHFCKLDKQ